MYVHIMSIYMYIYMSIYAYVSPVHLTCMQNTEYHYIMYLLHRYCVIVFQCEYTVYIYDTFVYVYFIYIYTFAPKKLRSVVR